MPSISYESIGKGKTILLLHGWGQNKKMMEPLIEELKYSYKCILLDLPGFGKSNFNNSKNIDEYTEKIKQFLDDKNVKPDYIIGHSFGGKIAFNYCLKYKNIEKLILIASPIIKPDRGIKYYYKIIKYKIKKKLGLSLKNEGSEDYLNCLPNMKSFFVNTVNTSYPKKTVKRLNIPTLLIWGKNDEKVALKKGKTLNKYIKKSELFIEEGNHFSYLENLLLTKLKIQEFIRRR